MKRKILVTGAGGYIGSVATYLLLSEGYNVVAIDNFTTGYEAPLKLLKKKFGEKQFNYYKADLRNDISPIFKKEKGIDAVLHYAASCVVDESMKNPIKFFGNNVCGTQNLLSTLQDFGINKLVFSSTCAVYGDAQYMPIDEKHPTNPVNPYGESKLIVEKIIQWQGKLSNLKYVIFRYFNVCGASDDGLIGDSKRPSSLLVQNAVRGALGIEPFFITCPKVNTPDKTPIRDYINVVDLDLAHLKALDYLLEGGEPEIINLGTGTGTSVLEVIKKVEKQTGHKFDLKKTTPREGENDQAKAKINKAKKILGWSPKRKIEDSVESLIKWYKTHPSGWSS